MLTHLSISNFALIESLDMPLSNGLTALTGETGSGKSIILGALGLVLGDRADHGALKDQNEKCIVEARFKVKENLRPFFDRNDLDYAEETILRREISSSGRSRSFVNDTPASLSVIKELGQKLVDIHSQHQHSLINDVSFRYTFLDAVAGTEELLSSYRQAKTNYTACDKKHTNLLEQQADLKRDADYYSFQLGELNSVDFKGIDVETFEAEVNTLERAEEIKTVLNRAYEVIESDELGALQQLRSVSRDLSTLENVNSNLRLLSERTTALLIELGDLSRELGEEAESVEIDPRLLLVQQSKLNALVELLQKHRAGSTEELQGIKEELLKKLASAENIDLEIKEAAEASAVAQSSMLKAAKQLSEKRSNALGGINTLVLDCLSSVGLNRARFELQMEAAECGLHGADKLNFLFSANPGVAPAPMENLASGGEISRIMLAMKAAFCSTSKMPTLIFDEIDTGVSGEVAVRVGATMTEMSKNVQIIAITHLPQIAGQAKHQFKVFKEMEEDKTRTKVRALAYDERIEELAEMISGKEISDATRQSAKQLLTVS
jgi:DNA repair protein RecN (Recombination protein N)